MKIHHSTKDAYAWIEFSEADREEIEHLAAELAENGMAHLAIPKDETDQVIEDCYSNGCGRCGDYLRDGHAIPDDLLSRTREALQQPPESWTPTTAADMSRHIAEDKSWERDAETVARAQHADWKAWIIEAGYADHAYFEWHGNNCGKCPLPESKHHPDMVDYDDLPAEKRGKYMAKAAYLIGWNAHARLVAEMEGV